MRKLVMALIFLSFLSACSPTFRELVKNDIAIRKTKKLKYLKTYQKVRDWENRLYEVGFPLMKQAVPFTDDYAYSGGFVLFDSVEYLGYTGVDLLTNGRAYDIATAPKVQYVHPDFPAYKAGLREGDIIYSIDAERVKDQSAKDVQGKLSEVGQYGRVVYLEVVRGKEIFDIEYRGEAVSPYKIELLYTHQNVSLANGKLIFISKGILDEMRDQEELSYYVSYQIASNILNNLWKQTGQLTAGAVFDLLALYATGIPTMGVFGKASEGYGAKEFVYQADIMSLYLLKSSGVSIDNVPGFWRDMDEKYPKKSAFDFLYYPPTPDERYQELMKNVAQMEDHFQKVR